MVNSATPWLSRISSLRSLQPGSSCQMGTNGALAFMPAPNAKSVTCLVVKRPDTLMATNTPFTFSTAGTKPQLHLPRLVFLEESSYIWTTDMMHPEKSCFDPHNEVCEGKLSLSTAHILSSGKVRFNTTYDMTPLECSPGLSLTEPTNLAPPTGFRMFQFEFTLTPPGSALPKSPALWCTFNVTKHAFPYLNLYYSQSGGATQNALVTTIKFPFIDNDVVKVVPGSDCKANYTSICSIAVGVSQNFFKYVFF